MGDQHGRNVIEVTPDAGYQYLRDHPAFSETKRGRELLVGCLLAGFLDAGDGGQNVVYFTFRDRSPIRGCHPVEDLGLLLGDDRLLEDADFDVVVGNQYVTYKIQIARVVRVDVGPRRKGLYEILGDKFRKQQPDQTLHLVIFIEEDIEILVDDLLEFVFDREIPFGTVALLGPSNRENSEYRLAILDPDHLTTVERHELRPKLQ